MRIRAATTTDVPALGRVMVGSWLAAHQGQVPDVAWRTRVAEWTPEVSSRGWARVLAAQSAATVRDDILLVAEDSPGPVVGLLYATLADTAIGDVAALYVASDRHREGIGAALLRAGAAELQRLGATSLRISVLTANLAARRFYEGMGGIEVGRGTFDEEGVLLPTTVYGWSDLSEVAGD